MKKKTWLTALAIAVMSMGLLIGCSGEGGEPAMDAPAGDQPMEPGMTAPEATETPEATDAPEASEETTAPEAETLPEAAE
ncbi:hypothetical protein FE782_10140 [Paenibacillus antri]|uniref:Uncharacterized protein n=1 Tax=Paenibacillus antri TaxID=2582848 RepID=A0A5R9GKR3_9BACL|nr:hypothetical protein [Paenibacillus antri]TLS52325.1 hypothetical protein FE782_10140 [Paenibacillus antri]